MEIPLSSSPTNRNGPTVGSKSLETPVERMRRYMESLPELPSPREEVCAGAFWRSLFAEFLATMLLVVFTYDPHSTASDLTGQRAGQLAVSYGSASAVLIRIFGAVDSVHMNPAVTVSLLAARRFSALRAVSYIACQILASLAGAGVGYALDSASPSPPLTSSGDQNYARQAGLIQHHQQGPTTVGSTLNSPPVPKYESWDNGGDAEWINVFGLEFLGTAVAVMTTLSCVHPRTVNRNDTAGFHALYVGISYSAGALLTRKRSGCSLNPARWLGMSLATSRWDYHWVYWISPVLAGLLGAFTYEYVQSNSATNAASASLPSSFRRSSGGLLAHRDRSKENNGHVNGVDRALMQNSVEMTLTSPVADYHM